MRGGGPAGPRPDKTELWRPVVLLAMSSQPEDREGRLGRDGNGHHAGTPRSRGSAFITSQRCDVSPGCQRRLCARLSAQ